MDVMGLPIDREGVLLWLRGILDHAEHPGLQYWHPGSRGAPGASVLLQRGRIETSGRRLRLPLPYAPLSPAARNTCDAVRCCQ
jgi:hypothetical protein